MSDRGSLRRGAPIAPRVLFVTPSGSPSTGGSGVVNLARGRWEFSQPQSSRVSRVSRKGFERNGIPVEGQPPGSALAARCSPWAAGGGRAPPLLLPGRYMPLVQGLRTPRKLLALAQKALFFGPQPDLGSVGLRPRAGAAGARGGPRRRAPAIGRHSCRLSAYARCVCRARAALPARLEASWSVPA